MKFDAQKYAYPSRRSVTFAKNGMVATSCPLAAQVGLETLKKGGNAIDAAVATAAALTVVEPTCNGIGSDAFALIWYQGKLYGLNGSGRAPRRLTLELLREQGHTTVPTLGWAPVMVHGVTSAWAEASKRFGRLDFTQLLEPAARYAEEGYPVAPNVAKLWEHEYRKFTAGGGRERFAAWYDTFAPRGRAPRAGELFRCPELAATLRELGVTHSESLYRGALAKKISEFSEATGGWLRADDLEDYCAEWVEPISTRYHGYDVFEMPPNGHGLTVLMALNILSGFEMGQQRETIGVYHRMIEAMKLAYADTREYVADPKFMRTRVEDLLSMDYAAQRRALIGEEALTAEPGSPYCGDTVYLCTADGEGNMVSWIQSNYQEFGSGIVIPGTGISMQNRGANFTLDPTKDNCLQPGKKSYHTIIPGFLCKDGQPVGPFGVMGAFMQPQGQLQVLLNTIDFGMNPQEALDAPRFQWISGKKVQLERGVPEEIVRELAEMGHEVEVIDDLMLMGRGEIIWRTDEEVLAGGSEPRCDGHVASW